MNDINFFLNTKIENSGVLAAIGDAGLTPFRYLFNGKTVRIETKDGSAKIHWVASFHENGSENISWQSKGSYSRFLPTKNKPLCSSSKSTIKTVVSVLLVVPGLFLSVAKLFSYSFQDVREKHQLVKKCLTPIDRTIGTPDVPIETIKELREKLSDERNSECLMTNALIIYGKNLSIVEDPGILSLNPKKLILSGVGIVHKSSNVARLGDEMRQTGKWQLDFISYLKDDSFKGMGFAVKEALNAKPCYIYPRSWTSWKVYHQAFILNEHSMPS